MSGGPGGLPVWMYWEGPMPDYIGLCVETVRRHHPEVQLLDPAGFDALWTTDRHVPVSHLGPHHRADFVRAHLLATSGGVWLDADVVLLRPLDDLLELPEPYTFCGYVEYDDQYANNFIASRPDDPVARSFYGRVVEHLVEGRPIEWLEIGAHALTAAVRSHPDQAYRLPTDQICPIPWHQARRFEEPGDATALIQPDRYAVMLSNNSMSRETRGLTRLEVLASDTLLGDLLRRALG